MFELTLANWPPVCRLLSESISEWFALFCVCHKLTIGFAVVGVINGVLMQETFKVAATDNTIMVRQKEKAMTTHAQKMKLLFMSCDSSGDGYVEYDEFEEVVSDPGVKTWLASMDLDPSDIDQLFFLIDSNGNGDGRISVEELIRGVSRLRGAARSIDMATLLSQQEQLAATMASLRQDLAIQCLAHAKHRSLDEAVKALNPGSCQAIKAAGKINSVEL